MLKMYHLHGNSASKICKVIVKIASFPCCFYFLNVGSNSKRHINSGRNSFVARFFSSKCTMNSYMNLIGLFDGFSHCLFKEIDF